VKSVIIKYDETKQKSRCFGFIEFDNEDSMQGVIRDKDDPGHTIDGKKIDPKIAQPPERQKPLPSSAQKVKKIFVGGVPPDLPESDIWEYFVQFGEVEEVALVTEKDSNKRRGFVFVTFKREDPVEKICEDPYHKISDQVRVEVKKAYPRDNAQKGGSKQGSYSGGGRGGYGNYGGVYPSYYPTYAYPYGGGYYPGGGYGGYQGSYGGGGGGGHGGHSGGYGSYGHPGGNQDYSSSGGYGGGYRRDEGGSGGGGSGAYRSYGGPGGPVRSNYHGHQGSSTYHPYHR
jgi:hypothetical protein